LNLDLSAFSYRYFKFY